MYRAYCDECHGRSGKGERPTGVTLGAIAPNLTHALEANAGRFLSCSEGCDSGIKTTGKCMDPNIWRQRGFSFRYVEGESNLEVKVRISRLVEYIRSLQQE
jgi:hypothetical protein